MRTSCWGQQDGGGMRLPFCILCKLFQRIVNYAIRSVYFQLCGDKQSQMWVKSSVQNFTSSLSRCESILFCMPRWRWSVGACFAWRRMSLSLCQFHWVLLLLQCQCDYEWPTCGEIVTSILNNMQPINTLCPCLTALFHHNSLIESEWKSVKYYKL